MQRLSATVSASAPAQFVFTDAQYYFELMVSSQPLLVSFDDGPATQYPVGAIVRRAQGFVKVALHYVATKFDGSPADPDTDCIAYVAAVDEDFVTVPQTQRTRYSAVGNFSVPLSPPLQLFDVDETRIDLVVGIITGFGVGVLFDTSQALSDPVAVGVNKVQQINSGGSQIWAESASRGLATGVFVASYSE